MRQLELKRIINRDYLAKTNIKKIMSKSLILGLAIATLAASSNYCGENERWVPGYGCDCKSGYSKLDGKNCEMCPKNGYWNPQANYGRGDCVCNWEYKMEDGECVPKKNMKPNV